MTLETTINLGLSAAGDCKTSYVAVIFIMSHINKTINRRNAYIFYIAVEFTTFEQERT